MGRDRKGSAVDLFFTSPEALADARHRVRAAKIAFHGTRLAWLDARKERSELRPARVVHRGFEATTVLETRRQSRSDVRKDTRQKSIKLSDDGCLFYGVGGTLRATDLARQRYSEQDLEWVLAFANEG